MEILSKIFRRKKPNIDEILAKEGVTEPTTLKPTNITPESTTIENVKAKMDLVLTQLDSLRTEYESLNGRVVNIEKMVKEIYDLAKQS